MKPNSEVFLNSNLKHDAELCIPLRIKILDNEC